jgi:hypothetical protein
VRHILETLTIVECAEIKCSIAYKYIIKLVVAEIQESLINAVPEAKETLSKDCK